MAGSVAPRKPKDRKKVKTGCATCRSVIIDTYLTSVHRAQLCGDCMCSLRDRIRKIKCDEQKPACKKCISTGRTCDGYQSPFRNFISQPINDAHPGGIKSGVGSQSLQPPFMEISPQDIDLLNRCFSTKTLFDIELGCDEEARQVLQASLSDPSIQHAISSLRALREDLETFGDGPAAVEQQTPSSNYGLQQYCKALGGLASNLSPPGSNGLKSALLCCQIFISIEQVRKNYAAMAQHIIRGLGIMHEYRARPYLDAANRMVPSHHDQLPLLDVFIIKLFAAPCKFAEPPATAGGGGTASSTCLLSPERQSVEPLRTIAPDIRTEITRIATSTLELLTKVSRVSSVEIALRLRSEKAALLDSLESWLVSLERVQTETGASAPEPISVSFSRLLHLILRIVLLGALDSSPDLEAELRIQNDQLQDEADNVGDRVRTYITCSGKSRARAECSTER